MIRALNAQDWERFDDFTSESVVKSASGLPEPTTGRDALRAWLQGLFTACPDYHVEVILAFGENDWVCAEFTATGTNTGPLQGPRGETIPATNKALKLPGCLVLKIEGGKFTQIRQYADLREMDAQLGLAS